jgi:hypothetical protein
MNEDAGEWEKNYIKFQGQLITGKKNPLYEMDCNVNTNSSLHKFNATSRRTATGREP